MLSNASNYFLYYREGSLLVLLKKYTIIFKAEYENQYNRKFFVEDEQS